MKDIKQLAKNITKFIKNDLPHIVAQEGLNFVKSNFENEGFTDSSTKKRPERKTEDKTGRDITRYRSDRIGRKGTLNRYGKKIKGRPILTGHASAGNKLRNSFRADIRPGRVVLFTYKKYAERHNKGLAGMPKRPFIGHSKTLEKNIEKKTLNTINRAFKP